MRLSLSVICLKGRSSFDTSSPSVRPVTRVMVNLNFSPNSWKNCRAGQGVGAVAIGDEAEAFRELPEVSESHAQAAAVLRGEPGNFLKPLF